MITTQGFPQAYAHLARIRAELSGQTGTLYRDIGEIVDDSILANFASAGRPAWPQRTREYSWPILNKTGAMGGRALEDTQNWEHGARVHHLNIRSTFYGYFHQYASLLNVNFAERKFVMLVQSEIERVKNRLSDVIK